MILHQFANGDALHRVDHALVAHFAGTRKVLSTAASNGGYRDDLRWVFNQDCKYDNAPAAEKADDLQNRLLEARDYTGMKAPTYAQHMEVIAEELGLDPAYACGLSTAADMENVSIRTLTYEDTTVTAVVTGGIDINGGRVGESTVWHESNGQFVYAPGTINILLFVDADLTESALAQALVTSAEAKTAAVQELLAPSCYSSGIATGSGTDGTIIISNAQAPFALTSAGKHCKLGELIGRTVMPAVKEALFLQTGLGAARQLNIFSRMGRFGVTPDLTREIIKGFYEKSEKTEGAEKSQKTENSDKSGESEGNGETPCPFDIYTCMESLAGNHDLAVLTSLYAHLLDQLQWGLLEAADAQAAGNELLKLMGMDSVFLTVQSNRERMIEEMATAYVRGIAGIVYGLLEDV